MQENSMEMLAKTIGSLLDASAALHQDKNLFLFGDKALTFIQTNEQVNRIVKGLKQLGISKGDKVCVMLPNGLEFPLTWLALAKLGAVMVPANINYRERDLSYILNDSTARVMIIHASYLSTLAGIRSEIAGLEKVVVAGGEVPGYYSFESLTRTATADLTPEDISEDDLVNIQYTSGTTGFPKGCMLTHRYWLLLAGIANEYLKVRPDDVDLTAQPFYYMDPQWNTVLCLMAGIPLVILERFSPGNFWPQVKEHGVTFFYLLGTMPFYLLKQKEDPELEKGHRLRLVICSGIYPEFHRVFEERWNVPWREAFGMTETGIDLAVALDDTASVGSGAMGFPVRSKEAAIMNEQGQLQPPGTVGELVVRGEPMMLGYWNKPAETAQARRGGWFHTGDLAYQDAQGYFHWTGRLKDMIRRSGENISAVEVEGVLMENEKVKAAAVVPVPDPLRGEEVKAYIVLQDGENPEGVPPESIVEFAKQRLAYFKVPRYVEYVLDLPRTPSERVEKHKLTQEKPDLRIASYDAVDKVWR